MAVIRTNEATPQEFTYKLRFRFVPGPPTIEVDQPASSRVLDQERFVVSARIEAPLRRRIRPRPVAAWGQRRPRPGTNWRQPLLVPARGRTSARHQRDRDRSPSGRSPGAGHRAGNRTQGDPGHVHEKATAAHHRPPVLGAADSQDRYPVHRADAPVRSAARLRGRRTPRPDRRADRGDSPPIRGDAPGRDRPLASPEGFPSGSVPGLRRQ